MCPTYEELTSPVVVAVDPDGPAPRQLIDVSALIDGQAVNRMTIRAIGICFLAMLSDGYDLASVAYAAPGIVQTMHGARGALGPVFSASLLGMMFGAPLLGYLGDRKGRRMGILLAITVYGLGSLSCAAAPSLPLLAFGRLFVGVGLGGLLPNVTAIAAEFAPKRLRATLTVCIFLGLTFGGMLPAITSVYLSTQAWRTLFLIGGAAPFATVPLIVFFLPESIKFLALSGKRPAELRRLAVFLGPGVSISPDATFVLNEQRHTGRALPKLFAGRFRLITPLLWIGFAGTLMVNFFLNSWMPMLLREAGLTKGQASVTAAMYYVGGAIGGLVIGRVLDRVGPVALVAFMVLAQPTIAAIGRPGLSQFELMVLVGAIGFLVLGSQLGLSASAGMIYPTAIRSNGTGWAHAVGRIGAISGPLLAGWLVSMHLPLQQLFLVPTVPLAIAAMASLVLTRLCTGRFRGRPLREIALVDL